ncbi:ABC transporter permease (plasmid) [Rhizobium sp. RCAM05350]|uniref:ABC transporter permease n=1 Tax=Rhizobium sp. RCAM05350 TaxID=2895568 RepID=UPI0020767897|nr:ABC transporter permease [Rhizobium sp. RCAM05350]URK89524.1 ABC transporter permease [Rhizobium sp. RCAM05350]
MDAVLRDQSFSWLTGNIGGIPREMIIAVLLLVGALILERRTTIGRAFKAIGAGELAAVASGLRVGRYKMAAFAISGAFAATAGLLFAVKLSGGSPEMANGFLLPAIVVVLVGGTPLTGGVGGVLNTLIGALIVAVIRTSMLYLEIPATAQQIFFGVVLIAAIAFTIDRSKVRTVK